MIVGQGATNIIKELHSKGEPGGVFAVGGSQGTDLVQIPMTDLKQLQKNSSVILGT